MKSSIAQVALKSLGTMVLAIAFLFLLARSPFLPSSGRGSDPISVESSGVARPVKLNAAAQRWSTAVAAGGVQALEADPSLGLLSAQFAVDAPDTGFSNLEHRVPGECEGAGRRHIANVCPDCNVLSGGSTGSEPEMLMWTNPHAEDEQVLATAANCTSVAKDGSAIVSTLQFGKGAIDFASGINQTKADTVPLLADSTRMATFAMGQWRATIDTVVRPDTVLTDMAVALSSRGWREVSGEDVADLQVFEVQRVFVNKNDELCIVTLSEEVGEPQLLTIVSKQTRG